MMPSKQVPLNLIIAHRLEAKPFIELFSLKPNSKLAGFEHLASENVNLLISGMGKDNAAAATAMLAVHCLAQNPQKALWVNAGIAGHQHLALGESFIANKITNRASQVHFYPALYSIDSPTSAVITVDNPETSYPDNAGYDMEASSFVAIASKFAPIEFVQVVKTVSDNTESDLSNVTPALIASVMKGNVDVVIKLIEKIGPIVEQINESERMPEGLEVLKKRIHFSVTQTNQLNRLGQRFTALNLETQFESAAALGHSNAKECLAFLNAELNKLTTNSTGLAD